MNMKKKISLSIIKVAAVMIILLFNALPVSVNAYGDGKQMVENGYGDGLELTESGLYQVNAAIEQPYNFNKIVGFEMDIRLIEQGSIGDGAMQINALVTSIGTYNAADFAMNFDGAPRYDGNAKELVTFSDSYASSMFFMAAQEVSLTGDSVTVSYFGDTALFNDQNTVMTIYGVFGSFEVIDIRWLIDENANSRVVQDAWPKKISTFKYEDVSTVNNGSEYNYIDIEVPEGEGPFPVVLWTHGGGWTQMNRKSVFIRGTMDYLLTNGYAVVSTEYTLSTIADETVISGYPDMIYDIKAAVRYIRANEKKYNLDTDFIVAMGESAGGHLSMLLGMTNSQPEYEDLAMGNESYSSDVQAIVSYFGPTNLTGLFGLAALGNGYTEEEAMAASPYYLVDENTPPIFLTHGINDAIVPIEQSYLLEEKVKELLGDDHITTYYYEDAPHASIGAFDTLLAAKRVDSFIDETYAEFSSAKNVSENNEQQIDNAQSVDEQYLGENEDEIVTEKSQNNTKNGLTYILIIGMSAVGAMAYAGFRKLKGIK